MGVWLAWCWGSNSITITWFSTLDWFPSSCWIHLQTWFLFLVKNLPLPLPTSRLVGREVLSSPTTVGTVSQLPQAHTPERWDVLVRVGQSWSWMWGQLHLDCVAWDEGLVTLQTKCYVLVLENKTDIGQKWQFFYTIKNTTELYRGETPQNPE